MFRMHNFAVVVERSELCALNSRGNAEIQGLEERDAVFVIDRLKG